MSRKMKALSIKQPWAWLIADGIKTIETRRWPTSYRGPLLIVASKAPDQETMRHFKVTEERAKQFEYGKAIAVVDLVNCRPMTEADEDAACCVVYENAFAWVLSNVRRIKPFDVKGRLGLYDIEAEIEYQEEETVIVPGWFDNGTGEGSVAG